MMKLPHRFCFIAAAAILSLPGLAAEASGPKPFYSDRTEIAQRQFGDVRFVMGAGQSMKWLEMYSGRNLIAAFRDFEAQDVHASPDGKYFLAISNARKSTLAFAVLDRTGHVVYSGSHEAGLHYCDQTTPGTRYWIDVNAPQARFKLEAAPSTSQRDFIAVTVRGCDGKEVSLGQVASAHPASDDARADAYRNAQNNLSGSRLGNLVVEGEAPAVGTAERATYFIGNTIANLRGLDPSFAGRTLTLVDGRRQINPPQSNPDAPAPAKAPEAPAAQ